MIDTLNLRLDACNVGDVDLLAEIPCYLDTGTITEHTMENQIGEQIVKIPYITGKINSFKVLVSATKVSIKDASLCKWYLGDNLQALRRKDIEQAITKISDTLHLPIAKAECQRIDIARNFVMNYPPEVYFKHLGECKNQKRLEQPNGLYYKATNTQMCYYDKASEYKGAEKAKLPEIYKNTNILRYELRLLHRLTQLLKVPVVNAEYLYSRDGYRQLVKLWQSNFEAIRGINDYTLNFNRMRTKKEFFRKAVLYMAENTGGKIAMLNQIDEARKMGALTTKQAYDLRVAINDACKEDGSDLVQPNEAIAELKAKVKQVVKYEI